MELSEVIEAIGTLDRAGVEAVFAAAKTRSQSLRTSATLVNKATLVPGTRVVTQNLKPKYLSGLMGRVVDEPARRGGDITIEVDEELRYRLGRYGNSATGRVGVPAGSLRKIEG